VGQRDEAAFAASAGSLFRRLRRARPAHGIGVHGTVLIVSAQPGPRCALPAGDGRNDIVPHDNQRADEQESSDQIEEAYFAKSLGSGKVLRMKCDLEEPAPSSERFDIGSPCRARDEQSAYEEQYSPEQE
jgi:hypothetical protein